jgi:hypothetical protein
VVDVVRCINVIITMLAVAVVVVAVRFERRDQRNDIVNKV